MTAGTPWWAWAWPALAWAILALMAFVGAGSFIAAAAAAILIATVFAGVYHAEVVAHRTGEPFGTLVLAVAVTVIEVALIVSVMLAAPVEKAGLARDTVFAAVMIVCNGIVGMCLLWGGARHHEQGFQLHGASAALAVLAALTCLTLIFPSVATTAPGPFFSTSQLVFAGIVSLVLYGSFVFVQTVRASRLLPPPRDRRRGNARAAALQLHHAHQRRLADCSSDRGRRLGEISHADIGSRRSMAWHAQGRGGNHHRGVGAVA